MSTTPERLVSIALAFAVGLELLVHGLTFGNVDAARIFPKIGLLHLGVLIVALPTAIVVGLGFAKQYSMTDLKSIFPKWAYVVLMALTIYAFASFVMFAISSGGAAPEMSNGKFILQSHGRLIRELSESDYLRHKMYETRFSSGLSLSCYLSQLLYSLFHSGRGGKGVGAENCRR